MGELVSGDDTRDSTVMDEEAFFERLYAERHKMYAIALSYLRKENDALEVVQEASCRAWMKRGKLRDEQFFSSWIIRITLNCCVDELRRRKRMFPVDSIDEGTAQEMRSNDRIDLERALEHMKPKYRHVVTLKYYQDLTIAQIAQVLRKPEGTVKTWLRTALKQLRDRL